MLSTKNKLLSFQRSGPLSNAVSEHVTKAIFFLTLRVFLLFPDTEPYQNFLIVWLVHWGCSACVKGNLHLKIFVVKLKYWQEGSFEWHPLLVHFLIYFKLHSASWYPVTLSLFCKFLRITGLTFKGIYIHFVFWVRRRGMEGENVVGFTKT